MINNNHEEALNIVRELSNNSDWINQVPADIATMVSDMFYYVREGDKEQQKHKEDVAVGYREWCKSNGQWPS